MVIRIALAPRRGDSNEHPQHTVSHFSYAPLFRGPHFLDKNAGIEHFSY